MEFAEAVAKRRSVRHFNASKPVSRTDILALLEAAIVSPSAGNIQPWRFTVVYSEDAHKRLAEALPVPWVIKAPAVIAVSYDPRPCAARYGDRGEQLYGIQDTAAAVQTILLAAVDRGLAACWIGAFDEREVADALGITRPIRPVALVALGYSAEFSGRPSRRPLDEVATWL